MSGSFGVMRSYGRWTVAAFAIAVAAVTVQAVTPGLAGAVPMPAFTLPPGTTPSATPTQGPSQTPCVREGVSSVDIESTTATSVTFTYTNYCRDLLQVRLYTLNVQEVARSYLGTGVTGTVTFSDLDPSTLYLYAYGRTFTNPDSSVGEVVRGPVRTLAEGATPAPTCEASMTKLARWGTGFTASMVVRNVTEEPITWQATWNWPGTERLERVYNAVYAGSPYSPFVTGAAWNRRLAPGE